MSQKSNKEKQNFDFKKEQNSEELIMLIELHRHGARRELFNIKNQKPFPDKNYDMGDLTIVGMKQHYLLGKQIRERYKNFLDEKPNYESIKIEASSSRRCLISAQSHMMGIFDLGTGGDVESDQHFPPFKGYGNSSTNKNALPYRHSPYPIITNQNNILFDSTSCKIFNSIKQKNFDNLDKKYSKIFNPLFKNLQKIGFNVVDIFGDKEWGISSGNSICDWIFTRIYYFNDFQISDTVFDQCKLMMAFNNFSRYKDKLYFRTFAHSLNKKILKIFDDRIENKNQTKLHILSGHDDNVTTFLMNLQYDNNLCILKQFDQKYNQGSYQDQFESLNCFDHMLFTTNIILQLFKKNSEYFIKMLYDGSQKFIQKSIYQFKDFQKLIIKNTDNDFQFNCFQKKFDNSLNYLMIVIALILIVLMIYVIFKRKKIYNSL